jgi:hypothetical protein
MYNDVRGVKIMRIFTRSCRSWIQVKILTGSGGHVHCPIHNAADTLTMASMFTLTRAVAALTYMGGLPEGNSSNIRNHEKRIKRNKRGIWAASMILTELDVVTMPERAKPRKIPVSPLYRVLSLCHKVSKTRDLIQCFQLRVHRGH